MGAPVILVTKTWLGHVTEAERGFGEATLDTFLHTLEAAPEKPAAIGFYTEGVKLVVSSSPVVLGLKVLADAGVRMLVCQSCLPQYGLADQVAVGTMGSMVDIVATVMGADTVVTV
jgi:intracellular sulfur oxidation DsrE/DsrF family protein